MAKKRKSLESKLGSWTDQANLTRSQTQTPEPVEEIPSEPTEQEAYDVARSLMERLRDVAESQGMTQNALVGYLLTWSLDQVESGAHKIAVKK